MSKAQGKQPWKRADHEDYLDSLLLFQTWCERRRLPWKRQLQLIMQKEMRRGVPAPEKEK